VHNHASFLRVACSAPSKAVILQAPSFRQGLQRWSPDRLAGRWPFLL